MKSIPGTSLRLSFAIAVTMTALIGVANSDSRAAELKPWRLGIVAAKGDAGFVMMPNRKDFAGKFGLRIETTQMKGDSILLKALLSGDLDAYEGSPGGPIIAASRGADIKLVGCYWPVLTYGLYAKSSIASIADTKGKIFGISGPGSLPDLVARAILEKNNISPSDVKFVIMGSDNDRLRALTVGIVDVAAASTEFVPMTKGKDIKLLVNAGKEIPKYLRFCIYMTSKTLAAHPAEAAAFLASKMEGERYALSHRDEVIALAKKVTGQKPDDPRAAYIFDEVTKLHAIDPALPIPMDKLEWMQNLLVKTGNLKKPIDLTKFVDGGPREQALKLVKGH
jgi:NitT/TauT family transport system substrate-binding protein